MKRIHLAILIFSLILMIVSGYSIAAINMIYDVRFDWYSKLNGDFVPTLRNVGYYEYSLINTDLKPRFEVVDGSEKDTDAVKRIRSVINPDFEKYIYVYSTLGEVTQIDSNIKIQEMAQRGSTVEIVAKINSTTSKAGNSLYYPEDIVRVQRKSLLNRGRFVFVFKNQFGARIAQIQKFITE